jgi:hypothetical protein
MSIENIFTAAFPGFITYDNFMCMPNDTMLK